MAPTVIADRVVAHEALRGMPPSARSRIARAERQAPGTRLDIYVIPVHFRAVVGKRLYPRAGLRGRP